MPYIGNEVGNRFVASKAASVYSGDGSTTAFTLEHAVGSDEDILVSVDGVIQEPSVAYAVSSGTTLTFTAAPSSNSGNNIFVYYLFRTVATVDHPSTSSLQATDGTFSAGVTATTGTFSGAVSAASLDADGGVTVDNITIDGTEIDLSSGNLTIDVAGQLVINSDSGQVVLQDDTVNWGNLQNSSGDFVIEALGTDKDMILKGLDGTSVITALTLDMSDAGTATFNHDVILPYSGVLAFNSTSNQYITADSSNLYIGSGNLARIIIDTNGHTTMPHQSAFLATNTNANQTNFAVGAIVDVNFGVEVFDQNADFASSTFTAPVAGKYQFNVNCRLDDMDSASNYYLVRLVTSNRNYTHIWDSNEFSSDTNYFSLQVSVLADMDASDTAKVIVYQNNGTQQTAVIDASYFSGHLVC